jgi:hypothetical protein
MVTAGQLEERVASLEKQREMLIGQFQAISGALEEAKYWLKEARLKEPPQEEPKE